MALFSLGSVIYRDRPCTRCRWHLHIRPRRRGGTRAVSPSVLCMTISRPTRSLCVGRMTSEWSSVANGNSLRAELLDFWIPRGPWTYCVRCGATIPRNSPTGLHRRDDLPELLTKEVCEQLKEPKVFGGHTVAQVRLLLRPTPGVSKLTGSSLFGFDAASEPRTELVRSRTDGLHPAVHEGPVKGEGRFHGYQHDAVCGMLTAGWSGRWMDRAELEFSQLSPTQAGCRAGA